MKYIFIIVYGSETFGLVANIAQKQINQISSGFNVRTYTHNLAS